MPRKYNPVWTPEELARLRELLIDGKTDVEICKALGRPKGGVAYQRHKMGAFRPPANQCGPHAGARPKPTSESVTTPVIPSDDEKHLALIAKANGGRGFPFCIAPAKYRVAA